MFLFTRAFWQYAGDRVVKSFGQAIIASNLADQAGVVSFDVLGVLTTAGIYALMSLATAMVAFPDIPLPAQDDLPEGEAEGIENQAYFEAVKADLAGSHRAEKLD